MRILGHFLKKIDHYLVSTPEEIFNISTFFRKIDQFLRYFLEKIRCMGYRRENFENFRLFSGHIFKKIHCIGCPAVPIGAAGENFEI